MQHDEGHEVKYGGTLLLVRLLGFLFSPAHVGFEADADEERLLLGDAAVVVIVSLFHAQ